MKTLLVLGAAGLVGSHAAKALKSKYDRLIGVDEKEIRSPYYDEKVRCSIDQGLEVRDDITVDDCLILAAARTDWGTSDAEYVRCNVKMMESFIDWHKSLSKDRRPRVLLVSTIGVYGNSKFVETEHPTPNQVYGRTKFKGENLLSTYCQKASCDFFIVRPAAIYGATDVSVIGRARWFDNNTVRMVRAIQRGRFFLVNGHDGIKSLAHLDDFSYFLSELLSISNWSEFDLRVVNFADRGSSSAGELAKVASEILGKKVITVPYSIAFIGCFFGSVLSSLGIAFPYTLKRLGTFGSSTQANTERLCDLRAKNRMRTPIMMNEGFKDFVRHMREMEY